MRRNSWSIGPHDTTRKDLQFVSSTLGRIILAQTKVQKTMRRASKIVSTAEGYENENTASGKDALLEQLAAAFHRTWRFTTRSEYPAIPADWEVIPTRKLPSYQVTTATAAHISLAILSYKPRASDVVKQP
jgi:hypothetical protein